jgi:hypothetical protein
MNLGDPQSFNRYSYVTSDPTNFVDPSGLLLRYFDVSMGMGCVLMGDGKFHCTEYINRYWYDDGAGGGDGGGIFDGGGGGGGPQSDKDKVRSQLDFYLRFKSLACEKALKALRVTDKQLLSGFDKNTFLPGGPSANNADTNTSRPWTQSSGQPKVYGRTTTTTTTMNGVCQNYVRMS